MPLPLLVSASACGIASHLLYFIRGEHHLNGFRYLIAAFVSPWILFLALVYWSDSTLSKAVITTTAIWWSYFLSLFGSMLLYRASPFHRLHNYPGPFVAKLTKMWHAKKASGFRNFEDLDDLHAKFGEYVRIGPSEISISDPAAIDLVHSPGNKCSKSMWYDLGHPGHTLQLSRDKSMHDKRRRTAWDRAFNAKALRSYDSRLVKYGDELLAQIRRHIGEPMKLNVWFMYYSADTLFDLAFGKSYDMIRQGEGHWFLKIVQEGSKHLATFGPIPWIFKIASSFPALMKDDVRAREWAQEQVKERRAMQVDEADIVSWLLEPTEQPTPDAKENELWLVGDTRLLIVAGTDTTSGTLTYAFYRLCSDASYSNKIRQELTQHGIDQNFSVADLRDCEYLNAFIDEVLRLHPAVPSGVLRDTPPEGIQIGDHYVPGEVTIAMPVWTMHRSPKCFIDPQSFIPERWTTRPDLILDRKGYMPFGIGAYGCVGKQLALMELRTVIAKLLLEFDVAFAPGEDGSDLLQKTKDYFILGLADFRAVFTPRNVVNE